jgi:hypothetical protein
MNEEISQKDQKESTNEADQLQKRKGRFARGLVRSAEMVLAELEQNPDLPQGMHYFINIMRDVFAKDQGHRLFIPSQHQGTNNRKIIGTYCLMVPEELICAGDELVPRDTCPVVKASIGFTSLNLISLYQMCDAVIVPTTCDAKRKMGEELSKLQVRDLQAGRSGARHWMPQSR